MIPFIDLQQKALNEKCSVSSILLSYSDDDYSQVYGLIKEDFKALTRDDILQPYKPDKDFRFSNDRDDIDYNLYVFDIQCQKTLEAAQPIQVEY